MTYQRVLTGAGPRTAAAQTNPGTTRSTTRNVPWPGTIVDSSGRAPTPVSTSQGSTSRPTAAAFSTASFRTHARRKSPRRPDGCSCSTSRAHGS